MTNNKRIRQILIENPVVTSPLASLIIYAGRFKSQKEAAQSLDISSQYLSDLLNGNRDIPKELGLKLGWEKKWTRT